MSLYRFYEQRLFPHVLDAAMLPFKRYRRDIVAPARGQVLEIGFGTGLNLEFYPAAVSALTAVDPMVATPRRLSQRLAAAPFPVHRYALPADGTLPFSSASFDCAVITWTLCTIPDPVAALRNVQRTLRPGGKLLFIEHGLSPRPRTARWQERLNDAWKVVACGCNLNRPIDRIVAAGGFHIEALREFDAPCVPPTHGHLFAGTAVRRDTPDPGSR